jgi:hypothetical protein
MTHVVEMWVSNLPLMLQSTLLSAVRGCDGVSKNDPSKQMVRAFRSLVLIDAGGDKSFMEDVDPKEFDKMLKDPDQYPMHWFMHFLHAAEIVGYKHPKAGVRAVWNTVYLDMCDALHVMPEGEWQMDIRLNPDERRKAKNGKGPTFTQRVNKQVDREAARMAAISRGSGSS